MAKRGLASLSLQELHRELRKRESGHSRELTKLQRKRESLVSKLAEVDKAIAAYGKKHGVSVKGGRRRPRNDSNLADALVQLLTGKTLGVTEIATEVQQAGYTTTSPNFRTIVNQTLIKDKRIKRVGRGQYTAK